MFRETLFFLSESPNARRLVTGTPISRHMAERFVAGESLEDAMAGAEVVLLACPAQAVRAMSRRVNKALPPLRGYREGS